MEVLFVYSKIELTIKYKDTEIDFSNKEKVSSLIPRLASLFNENEITNFNAAVFKNVEKRQFLVLFRDQVQITNIDLDNFNDYLDFVDTVLKNINDIFNINKSKIALSLYTYHTFSSGRSLIKKLIKVPDSLKGLAEEISPDITILEVKNKDINYHLLFDAQKRGLKISLRFYKDLKSNDIFPFLNEVKIKIQEEILPLLKKATNSSGVK